jgi:hypothetical protein
MLIAAAVSALIFGGGFMAGMVRGRLKEHELLIGEWDKIESEWRDLLRNQTVATKAAAEFLALKIQDGVKR